MSTKYRTCIEIGEESDALGLGAYRSLPTSTATQTTTHSVMDAKNRRFLLTGATTEEFDDWYGRHPEWRSARDIYEVRHDLRDAYARHNPFMHYMVKDDD